MPDSVEEAVHASCPRRKGSQGGAVAPAVVVDGHRQLGERLDGGDAWDAAERCQLGVGRRSCQVGDGIGLVGLVELAVEEELRRCRASPSETRTRVTAMTTPSTVEMLRTGERPMPRITIFQRAGRRCSGAMQRSSRLSCAVAAGTGRHIAAAGLRRLARLAGT